MNLLGGCKYKIYNMTYFVILYILYLHPPNNSKFTVWHFVERDITYLMWILYDLLESWLNCLLLVTLCYLPYYVICLLRILYYLRVWASEWSSTEVLENFTYLKNYIDYQFQKYQIEKYFGIYSLLFIENFVKVFHK